MRKNYLYAFAIVILSLAIWFSYYLYVESRPTEYKNGTFVELPREISNDELELCA